MPDDPEFCECHTFISGKEILQYCYSIGAEAAANGRKYMNKNDRDDIALKSGFNSWNMIPQGQQEEAQRAFYDGWKEENDQ